MKHLLYVLVYLSLTSGLKDPARQEDHDQPYCAVRYRRLCQGKGRHVGCQFPEAGPGMSCENYSPILFHNDMKHFITHYINRRRQRIASGSERVRGGAHLPKPELMMMVEWDRELASLAQRLADQCSFVHDDCRATVRYPYAGQTVGEVRWRRSSDSDTLTAQRAIRRVFDAWWGERRRVQTHQLTAPFRVTAKGAVWGHFSQLAVWSLSAVGCGAVRHGNSCPRMLLVCDFSHTNMLGQRTLTPGPLAPCPIHTTRRPRSAYPLLCAPVRHQSRTEPQYEYESDDEQTDLLDNDDSEDDGPPETPGPGPFLPQPMRNVTKLVAKILSATPKRLRGAWRTHPQAVTKSTFKAQESDEDHNESAGENQVLVSRSMYFRSTTQTKKTTKGVFMDKLDHELDARLKAQEKFRNYQRWQTRLSGISSQDTRAEALQTIPPRGDRPRPALKFKTTSEMIEVTDSDEDVTTDVTTLTTISPTLVVRHKWQQPRNRPLRPGASALLNIPMTAYTRRASVVVMNFDKEDVDQLFRDTGFNPSWMRPRV